MVTAYLNSLNSSQISPEISIDEHLANIGETVDLNENFSHPLVEEAYQSLMLAVSYLEEEQLEEVTEACHFADKAHINDKRKSGEPYITHPIAVAEIIAGFQLDRDTIISAILHDTVEDTEVTLEVVREKYGVTVARLVDGVTKLKSSDHNKKQNKAATFHKILLSTLEDPRVLIVKLSDRLHNMSTLGAVSKEKQQATARETLNFYIPFARVMGMNDIADHIEILCYRNLDYEMYTTLSDKLLQHGLGRKLHQEDIQSYLQRLLHRKEWQGHVKVIDNRVAMYRKFFRNRGNINQLIRYYDFQIVLDSIASCKALLNYLVNKYQISEEDISDNIRNPLPGGNQSLTITYKYKNDSIKLVILTEEMQENSRLGVIGAKHNTSDISQSVIQASLRNMKDLLSSLSSDNLDFSEVEHTVDNLIGYLNERKILCYSPTEQAYELPRGSTALDFAYAVGPFIGNIAIFAIIDGREVDLATVINNGQHVEIITNENAMPKAEWLGFVATVKARELISHWLRDLSVEEKQEHGKQALARALQTYEKDLGDLTDADWENLLLWRKLDNKKELYQQITTGSLLPQLVVARLFSEEIKDKLHNEDNIQRPKNLLATLPGVEISFPKCCNPIYGDPIIGYNSNSQGLVIHRHKCHGLIEMREKAPERLFHINWRDDKSVDNHRAGDHAHFSAYLNLHMLITDEQVLSGIVSHLRKKNIGIAKFDTLNKKSTILHVVVRSRKHLEEGIEELRNLLGFTNVQRMYHINTK